MISNRSIGHTVGRLAGHAIGARQRADGRPVFLAHFVTHRCLCKCASCLWHHDDWDDVPLEDLKRFYREAKEQGFVATGMSGGEPFMRKDLGELTHFVKNECDMAVLVFTTGWYLRTRMHDVLPNIDLLVVSIDSARPERHNEIRGVPGMFERAIASVKEAKAAYPDLAIHFNCCIQRGVTEEIDDLVALAKEVGVGISFDVITTFRNGDDDSHFTETDVGLSPDEVRAVSQQLLDRKRAGDPIVNSERYFQYFANGAPGYRCHFPKLCMSVDGRGNIEDCLNLTQPIANLRETPLAEIMQLPRFRQLRCDAEGCSSCNSPTMVDLSHVWERPELLLQPGGIALSAANAHA